MPTIVIVSARAVIPALAITNSAAIEKTSLLNRDMKPLLVTYSLNVHRPPVVKHHFYRESNRKSYVHYKYQLRGVRWIY